MSKGPTRPSSKKRSVADHAARYILGGVGLTALSLLIVGALALSVSLAGPALLSGQLAAVVSARLVDLTNTDRASDQLGTLTVSPVLTAAAQAKADDMAKNGYFAHVSPSGLDSWHWFKLEGYSFSYAGENLAVDFTDSDDVNQAWLNSPTHRANILNGHFTEIGVATAEGTFEGHPTTFVVQMFGTPAQPAPITASVLPSNPSELAVAHTDAAPADVLGASAEPAKQASAKIAPAKVAVADAEPAAPSSTVATAAPALVTGTAAPVRYAPFWARLVSSPRALLRGLYALFALCLIFALAVRTRLEFRQHHIKHMVAVLALLAVMGGLFFAADRFVFIAPVIGTAQSI